MVLWLAPIDRAGAHDAPPPRVYFSVSRLYLPPGAMARPSLGLAMRVAPSVKG